MARKTRARETEEFEVPELVEDSAPAPTPEPVQPPRSTPPVEPAPAPAEKKPVKTWEDHVPPKVTAETMQAAWQRQHDIARETRLELLARSNEDVRWLLEQFQELQHILAEDADK